MTSTLFRPAQNPNLTPQNDDQRTVLSSLKAFLKNKVEPGAAERDQTGEFPFEIVKNSARWASWVPRRPRNTAARGSTAPPLP